MGTGERSKGGCWTCKLRKKKCDEIHPICSICRSLQISCHGYGARPLWLDGGAQEKRIITDMRVKVRETLSQRRRNRSQHGLQDRRILSPPRSSSAEEVLSALDIASTSSSVVGSTTDESTADLATIDTVVAQGPYPSPDASAVATSDSHINNTPEISDPHSRVHLDEVEAGLWMHYLDRTFPHQFPFYKPTTKEGGRGWLFILVMQTEPLYHAVLSIAAYHQHYELLCDLGNHDVINDCWRAGEELRRYNVALQKLQRYLDESISGRNRMSKPECLKLLACIVFLISLEVFKSTGSAWKIHLEAAASLLPRMKETCVESPEELVGTQVHAWQFVAGTLAWYNTLSCISNNPPSPIPSDWLCDGLGYLSQARIMGCEDWAISKIREITVLRKWKDSMQATRAFSIREFALRAAEIEDSVENRIKTAAATVNAAASCEDQFAISCVHEYGSKHTSLLITRIFAHAALAYLFAVVSGANPNLPEIQNSVGRTMAVIRDLHRLKFFCNLSWPLCVAGCLSVGGNEEEFKHIMEKYNSVPHHFGSSQHVSRIVQKCWELRKNEDHTTTDVDWTSAMQALNLDILLV